MGFLKAHKSHKVSNEMKCTNKMIICNSQDTSWYVTKANVDHTNELTS